MDDQKVYYYQLPLYFIFQVQKLSHSFTKPYELDKLLSTVTVMGAYFYAIFSMIASGVYLPTLDTKTIMVFSQSALLFIQVTFQGMSFLTNLA